MKVEIHYREAFSITSPSDATKSSGPKKRQEFVCFCVKSCYGLAPLADDEAVHVQHLLICSRLLKRLGRGFCLCHPALVQLHYLAVGTQTGGSHSLVLWISESFCFWGPKASAFTPVRMKRWGEGKQKTEKTYKNGRESGGAEELAEKWSCTLHAETDSSDATIHGF